MRKLFAVHAKSSERLEVASDEPGRDFTPARWNVLSNWSARSAAATGISLAMATLSVSAALPVTVSASPVGQSTTAHQAGQQVPALVRDDLEAWLDGYLPYAMRRADVAGAVVVVVKDGSVLLQKGYGHSDVAAKKPVDPELTLFRAGSVSKLVTWTAVMQLVEQHKLDLDRDINTYLDFKVQPMGTRPITMRNLMTHTAGFQDSLKDLITTESIAPALGDFLKRQIPDRIFRPGDVPGYSNYAAGLAGYIVERVSGQPFADYAEQHIFNALGMRHSTFRQPLTTALAPLMAKGYLEATDDPKPFEVFSAAPAGGLTVSGADMAKFMIAHLQNGEFEGRRILAADTARALHTTALTTVHPALNRLVLGFFEANRNGHRVLAHDGDTRLFHSALSLLMDDNVGLFISLNSAGREQPATRVIRQALFEGFVDRYFPPRARAATTPVLDAKAHGAMVAGEYEGTRREDRGFFSFTGLLSQVTISVDDSGRLVAPFVGINERKKTYEEIAPFLWREVDGNDLLAAKIENEKVAMWGESGDASTVYTPAPMWRRAGWLLPSIGLALTALLVTTIAWPVAAVIRRRYGARLKLTATVQRLRRWTKVAVATECILILSWLVLIGAMVSTFLFTFAPYFISSSMDKWILVLHLLSIVVFPVAAVLAICNSWVTFAAALGWRGMTAALWSGLVAISSLMVLWVAIAFDFIGIGTSF